MFWKFLLIWALIGIIAEVVIWLFLGAYAAWREEKTGTRLSDRAYEIYANDHTKWVDWFYRVFPRLIAVIIHECLEIGAWPLEVLLSIVHFKRFIDQQLPLDVNKAS